MKFRFCEYMIEDSQYSRYCGEPAEMVNTVPEYLYLCRKHHMELDGRSDLLREYGKEASEKSRKLRRICPQCERHIVVEYKRRISRLNFCDNSCRAKFYYYQSGLKYRKGADLDSSK